VKFQIQSLSRTEKVALAVHVTSKNKNVPHFFGGKFRLLSIAGGPRTNTVMMRASLLQTIFSRPRSLRRNYTHTTTTPKNHIEILEALQNVYSLSLEHSLYPSIPPPSAPNLHPPTIQLHSPPRRIQARTSPTTPSKRGAGALRAAAKSVYRSVQHTEGSPQNQSISPFYRVERPYHQSCFGGHSGARRRYERRRRRAPSEYKKGG
jgi:hypothetical protein